MFEVKRKLSVSALIKIQNQKDDLKKAVIAVSCVCEVSEKEVLNMDADEFMQISNETMASINTDKKKVK